MKVHEYNEMMAYMLRPRQKFAIGGGVVEGEDLGSREGFSKVDKILQMNKEIKEANLKKIKDFIKNFKIENKRLPKMVEIEEGTGFSRSTIFKKGLKPGVDYLTMGESQKLRVRDLPEEQIKVIDYVKDLPDGTIVNRPLIQKYIDDNNLDVSLERFFTKDAASYLPNHITNKKVKFDPTYRGAVGDTKQYKKSKEILNDPVLKEKFIKFSTKPNIKKKDILEKFNISDAEFFEGGLREILPKDVFIKYNQGKLFDYLLNAKGDIDLKQVAKDLKMTQEGVKKSSRNLYQNIYKAFDPDVKRSRVLLDLGYNSNQLKNVANKIKTFPSEYHDRTLEKLLIDAYGETPKKLKPLLEKLKKFRELQKELPEKYQKFFRANFDHVIPFNFLKQLKEGKNPENLIRVKAYPEFLNQAAFKANFDRVLNEAKFSKDKNLIKTITEIQKYLPEDFGKIDSQGKRVIDYKAKPFNLKTLYTEQQKKFGEVYDRTQKFLDNPKVIELLKDAGISLRAISQIRRLNVPGFISTFNKILQRRPDLRVELGDEYSDIENQYASASMMSDVSPAQTKEQNPSFIEEYPYLVGTTAAASPLLTKTGRKIYGGVLKGGLKAFGSVPSGLGFSASQFVDINPFSDEFGELQEDPNVGLAGADLLLPELGKRVAGSGTGILAKAGRFALNPFQALEGLGRFGRAGRIAAMGARIPSLMTPVGLGLMGIEGVMMGMREQERINQMRETDPEAYQEFIADQEDMLRESAAYGGRMGFAEGPKDPSKRKFMKIMGGLASLPVVGKFFRVAEQTPVVQNIFTEIQKLKNSETLMPDWFPTFLDKFRREGVAENIFKKKKVEVSKAEYDKALAEGRGENYYTDVARTQEYKANNPDHMDYYKLEDTDQLIGTTYTNEKVPGVKVDDFDGEVSVNWENDYSQPVSIEYVKPGAIGPDMGRVDKFQAGIEKRELKPEGEFAAVDQEVYATDPDGGFDTNAIIVQSLDDMMEGTTRVMEEYATGKPVRTLSRGEGKVIEAEVRAEQAAESAAEMADDFDDFQ